MEHELTISPSLKYRFASFSIDASGTIQATVKEYSRIHTDTWDYHVDIRFAGNHKGADFWLPATEARRPEIGHVVTNKIDERISVWLSDVWRDLTGGPSRFAGAEAVARADIT
jgi:hypothetical protein